MERLRVKTGRSTGVCGKSTPTEKKTGGNVSFKSTKSWAGELFFHRHQCGMLRVSESSSRVHA